MDQLSYIDHRFSLLTTPTRMDGELQTPDRNSPERLDSGAIASATQVRSADRALEATQRERVHDAHGTPRPELRDLRIEDRPIASRTLRRTNPRTHSEKQIRQIAASTAAIRITKPNRRNCPQRN